MNANGRWIVFGAALLVIAIFGTAGAVSGNSSAGFADKAAKIGKDVRDGRGPGKDKMGPGAKGTLRRQAIVAQLFRDEEAGADIRAAIAETLGLAPDELAAAVEKSDGLEALMKSKGVTPAELGAAVAAAAKPHIGRLVEAGKIDQAAAEAILAQILKGAWTGKFARLAEASGR